MIREAGAEFLLSVKYAGTLHSSLYRPDLHPIEMAFAGFKVQLRAASDRTSGCSSTR